MERAGLFYWEKFSSTFINSFFPFEMREAKVLEFINLLQGSMSVMAYSLKLKQLYKYALSILLG